MFVNPIDLDRIKHMYFIGIGGIGMSALARYFEAAGVSVSGYYNQAHRLNGGLVREMIYELS